MIRLKDLLSEGYREVDDLDRIATAATEWFVKRNSKSVIALSKGRSVGDRPATDNFAEQVLDKIRFSADTVKLSDLKAKYSIVADFVKSWGSLKIEMTKNITSFGVWQRKGKSGLIQIKLDTKIFGQILSVNIDNALRKDGSVNSSDAEKILRTAMMNSHKTYILHELQHAYDEWRSNGLYASDKRSVKYYEKSAYQTSGAGAEKPMSPEEWAEYVQLPHEYWARFSEAMKKIFNKPIAFLKPYPQILKMFTKEIVGWEYLQPTDRRRLVKALEKYWSEGRQKLNV
jgi:hypothetical protein